MTKREVSLGRRLAELAAAAPGKTAVVLVRRDGGEEEIDFGGLDARANQVARLLAARGVDARSRVGLGLANSLDYFIATYAIWRLGACVFPLRSDLPAWERERLVAAASPTHMIGDFGGLNIPQVRPAELAQSLHLSSDAIPDVIPAPYKANATGGSTGVPKIVVPTRPGVVTVSDTPPEASDLSPDVRFVAGPLYHYGPSLNAIAALNLGCTLVVFERFVPEIFFQAVERRAINSGMLVPTMLYRVLEHGVPAGRELDSLRQLMIAGAKCADWVLERAIQTFGPERVWVGYGGTENIGRTGCSGAEWLSHRGTTGRGVETDIQIRDARGEALPPGEVGEVWMRPHGGLETRYAYAALEATAEGYATLGDLGWLDEEGFLYIADRRRDLIVSGGANVYPAEVEAALLEHPQVSDVAVVGLADSEWGATVHAVVVPTNGGEVDPEALRAFCRSRLASYKVPKSVETVSSLPRDDLGKLRRSALVKGASVGS